MKYASLITIVFAVLTLLFAQNTKAASTDTTFDGTWSAICRPRAVAHHVGEDRRVAGSIPRWRAASTSRARGWR